MVSQFMVDLGKKMLEVKDVNPTTVNTYMRNLYMLNDKKPFTSLVFLKNYSDIESKLEKYKESSQKTFLGGILSVLSLFNDKKGYKKIITHYKNLLDGKEVEETNGEKTAREGKNWITWEEVQRIYKDLQEKVTSFYKKKTLTDKEYETLLMYLLLSLYTLVPPRRNLDYLQMFVVKKWDNSMSKDINYLDFAGTTNPTRFIFNVYKTAKTHGEQIVEIPKELVSPIQIYLKHNKAKTTKTPYSFLVKQNGSKLTVSNSVTRLLNKIFGKRVGSSMLRHIYLSSKYDLSAMEKDATAMGHTIEAQRTYLRKDEED